MKTKVEVKKFAHDGGGKVYDLIAIYADGGYALIRRWGKLGGIGQIKVETYVTAGQLASAMRAQVEVRQSRGYHLSREFPIEPDSFEGFLARANLRPFQTKLIEAGLVRLFPNEKLSVSGELPSGSKSAPARPAPVIKRPELWGSW